MNTSEILPLTLIAGETIWIAAANTVQSSSDIILSDFTPAAGYTLAFEFTGDTPVSITAAANGDDTGWTLTVPAATTLTWNPPQVHYSIMATKTSTGMVFAAGCGVIKVTASPLKVSSWVAVIESCDAATANYAKNPNGSFMIDGIQVTYRSLTSIINLRAFAVSKLNEETGNRPIRVMRSTFT